MDATKVNDPRLKMIGFNTAEQVNLVLYDVLKNASKPEDLAEFFRLLKQGYGITPFILNYLISKGFEKNIPKVLQVSRVVSLNVYDFLCLLWGQKETEDFLVKNEFTNMIKEKFPDESLIAYGLWDILVEKEAFLTLAKAGRFDLLKECYQQNRSKHPGICNALKEVRAVNVLADLQAWSYLTCYPEGNRKLIECQKWEYLFTDKNRDPSFYGKLDIGGICRLIYDGGGEECLYNLASWGLGNKVVEQFLFKNGYYRFYIEQERWYHLASEGRFEAVDWERYHKQPDRYKHFPVFAAKAKRWDILAKYKYRWTLLKAGQFKWFCRSFK